MFDIKNATDEELLLHHKHLVKEVSKLHNLQMAMKIALNSAYGAVG
jgi:DNA polymerase elongation subunit (family B)